MGATPEIGDRLEAAMSKAWLLRLALAGPPDLPGELTAEALIQGARSVYEDLEQLKNAVA
jgi:hypothetical protein